MEIKKYPKKIKELDLSKILKNTPIGTKLYSTLHGEVEFKRIEKYTDYITVTIDKYRKDTSIFTKNGIFYPEYPDSECVLFPSKENRDWSTFKVDYPIDTPMMCSDNNNNWALRYYATDNRVFSGGLKCNEGVTTINFKYIIPVSEFDFVNKCRLTNKTK